MSEIIVKTETRDINIALMSKQTTATFGDNFLFLYYSGYKPDLTKFTTEKVSDIEGRIFIPREEGDPKLITGTSIIDGIPDTPIPGQTYEPGELRFEFQDPLTEAGKTTLTNNITNHNELNVSQEQGFADQDKIDYERIDVLRKISNRTGAENMEALDLLMRTQLREFTNLQE